MTKIAREHCMKGNCNDLMGDILRMTTPAAAFGCCDGVTVIACISVVVMMMAPATTLGCCDAAIAVGPATAFGCCDGVAIVACVLVILWPVTLILLIVLVPPSTNLVLHARGGNNTYSSPGHPSESKTMSSSSTGSHVLSLLIIVSPIMDDSNPESTNPPDTYLDALKNLPKLPEMHGVADDSQAEGWCGPDSQVDNIDENEDDIVADLGPQASDPLPKTSTAAPSQKLKRKASAIIPDSSLTQFGPTSNTCSMRAQTETSFIAAGGEPSPSFIPRKCPRLKGKSPEPSTAASTSDQSEWKAAMFNLHAQFETEIRTLQDQLEALFTAPTPASLQPELSNVTTNITSLQK
ncbi:hypothetical protein F5146DRAFT_1134157 [Armillaria mellea]|nr:hypothetical protein F5146DRAFT_1134157 [Armillaria mellea]